MNEMLLRVYRNGTKMTNSAVRTPLEAQAPVPRMTAPAVIRMIFKSSQKLQFST
jgi:hypothetical protein